MNKISATHYKKHKNKHQAIISLEMLNSEPEHGIQKQEGKRDGSESSQEENQIKEKPAPRRNNRMKTMQKPPNNLTFTYFKDREFPRVECKFSRDDLEYYKKQIIEEYFQVDAVGMNEL